MELEKLKQYRRNLLNQMEQLKGALAILEQLISDEGALIGDSPEDIEKDMKNRKGDLVP